MKRKYKKIILLKGKNLDDMFFLPCVRSIAKCMKLHLGKMTPTIRLKVTTEEGDMTAYPGDYLAEDQYDEWHLLTDGEYRAYIEEYNKTRKKK